MPSRRIVAPLLPLLTAAALACEGADGDRPGAGEGAEPAGSSAPAVSGDGVVASIHPIASITRSLAGDGLSVRALLPPGAHPDSYEPTPRLAEALADARLVVRVGGAVDDWLDAPGREVVLTEGLPLLGRDDAPAAAEGTGNSHVWLDPILVRDALLPRLVGALVRVTPSDADAIRARAASFADSLTALDAEIRALLDDAPRRAFVASHPAWSYFARRYDLQQVGVLHPSPGEEIGARGLAALVERARRAGVAAAIAEPQLGRAGLDAMAGELEVRVEVADPVGGEGLEGREDYLSLMRFNARAFARALGAE